MLIKRAAVIGAGTMGSGIACHLANAGVPSLLLDVVPADLSPEEKENPAARSRLAVDAVRRSVKSRPPAYMDRRDAELIEPGNLEDHLDRIGECDWIVEAVVENLDVKRDLFARLAKHRRPGSIVSSNTSGLSLQLLTEGLDDDFRQHFLITHFFNPPRFMYLLELIKGPETRPEVLETISAFADRRLGKGIVHCKDTPNFIANRIGVFCMGASCYYMLDAGLRVEEVDALTGPIIGRPKTASFRLHDLVGIDVAVMVMENAHKLVPDDESRDLFIPPDFLKRLVQEGRFGRKSGAGFYKKEGKEILVLDLDTFEYGPQKKVKLASLERAKKKNTTAERMRALVNGKDAAAGFSWRLLSETLLYSARRVPEITDDIVSVDRALRWGFNWEMGPFEIWDALGVKKCVDRLSQEGREVPELVENLLRSGQKSFYAFRKKKGARRRVFFDLASQKLEPVPERPGVIWLDDIRERDKPLSTNSCASIWNLGDGVLGVEFHSKMNSLSEETLDMLVEAADVAESGDYAGVVIGNQAANFSVGANLVGVSTAAKEQRWDLIESMIRKFQHAALRLRYCARPVVAAVQGMALGGGCEIPLACARVQAAAETYMGLVELGVGLIPGGGGTRELACRAAESVPLGTQAELFPYLRRSFEAVAQARVSSSAEEARAFGFLSTVDGVSMNRDRTLADAKRAVLHLAEGGYRPPRRRTAVRVAGEPGLAEMEVILHQFHQAGYASDYDVFLGRKFAHVLCGGAIDAEYPVREEYLLDLEREVFLSLCGEAKTLERIEHTLKTGKPLRN